MAVEAVLWDLDGTLADSEPLHQATLVMSLRREGIAPPAGLEELLVGLPSAAIHRLFAERFGLRAAFREWSRFRCDRYLEQAGELQARPETLALYRQLQQRGVRQAIVSNSDRLIVQATLQAIGLAEPDQVTVTRSDVRQGKPDPEPYLRAMWLLDAQPQRSVVIEDSPTGSRAGLAAGCRTLFWSALDVPAPAGCEIVRDGRHALELLVPEPAALRVRPGGA